jgi:hypothetical protein
MLFGARAALALLVCAVVLSGCRSNRAHRPPALVAPYQPGAELVWAVAPLRNESGVGLVDELAISDDLVNTLQSVRGVSAVPVNRAIAGMRSLGLASVESEGDALALAREIGADAILVGVITAYEPYDPPEFGIGVALFSRSPRMLAGRDVDHTDPMALQLASSDTRITPGATSPGPLSVVARHYDAAEDRVRRRVTRYASAREGERLPLGPDRYTKSMRLYTKFVCHEMVEAVLDAERSRLERLLASQAQVAPE